MGKGSWIMCINYIEIEFDNLRDHIKSLIEGKTTALLIKKAMPLEHCHSIYNNFINSPGLYQRDDGVPALMVGANTFLQNPESIILELKNNVYADMLFHKTSNIYQKIYDSIEDAGYRFRRAYVEGIPAPIYRGTIWNNTESNGEPLLAHTDWPQVKYSGLEFQNIERPIAINFYPKHPPKGYSSLRLYDLIPDEKYLDNLGIKHSGYPIYQEKLTHVNYIDIFPEDGDILLFNSAYVHAVNEKEIDKVKTHRLNINGFFGFCNELDKVLAWA